ncbi:MAG TPA: TetR/AcrR family transcriptional regulator [Candidatus Dormibacteraeota bacterium]
MPRRVAGARRNQSLTRREAKQLTRWRLLDAARRLILTGGESELSASAVARLAGVGGATFYEHFRNKDHLLQALAGELFTGLREGLHQPRREALEEPASQERIRQQFRVPVEMIAANPEVFRLSLRTRHQAGSALGRSSQQLNGNLRTDLVEELVERGYPNATLEERRRLEMVADIHIAATEALALGHVNGRYPDIEEIVDLLVLVTRGTRLMRERPD